MMLGFNGQRKIVRDEYTGDVGLLISERQHRGKQPIIRNAQQPSKNFAPFSTP